MGNTVQEALEERRKRLGIKTSTNSSSNSSSFKSSYDEVNAALESRKTRREEEKDSVLADLYERYNFAIGDYTTAYDSYEPSYGKNSLRDTLDKNRQNTVDVSTLKRDILAYSKLIGNDDAVNEMLANLEKVSGGYRNIFDNQKYHSQFETKDDEVKYEANWLRPNTEDTPQQISARKDIYEGNKKKIEDINKQLKGKVSKDQKKALEAEKKRLEDENRQYERTQGKADSYAYLSYEADFDTVSANRDFKNPTREELTDNDIRMDSSRWYTDAQGRTYNAFGEEVAENDIYGIKKDSKFTGTWYLKNNSEVDRLGLYLSTDKELHSDAIGNNGSWEDIINAGINSNWEKLTDEEVSRYYYLRNTQGQEKADKFLDDMTQELNRRATEEYNANMERIFADANPLERAVLNLTTVPVQALGNVAAGIEDTFNIVTGQDINPYSPAHSAGNFSKQVRGLQAERFNEATGDLSIPLLDFSAGDAYQAGMSYLDMLTAYITGPTGYAVQMGLGAGSDTASDLYLKGASMDEVAGLGVTAGVAEGFFEYFSIDKLIKIGDSKTLGQVLKNIAVQGGIEASEEAATEITNIVADAIVRKGASYWSEQLEKSDGNILAALGKEIQQVGKAALSGFIAGALGGGASSSVNYAAYQGYVTEQGQGIIENKGYDDLKKLAIDISQEASGIKSVDKAVERADKKNTARRVGKLSETVDSVRIDQNTSDIEVALIEKGMTERQARRAAKTIVEVAEKNAAGVEISKAEYKAIRSNPAVAEVYSSLVSDTDSSVNARNFKHENARQGIIVNEDGSVTSSDSRTSRIMDAVVQKVALDNVSSKSHFKANTGIVDDVVDDVVDEAEQISLQEAAEYKGKTTYTDPKTGETKVVKIQDITSIKDGEMILKLDNGEKVNAENVRFSSEGEALVYSTVLDMGVNAGVGSAIVRDFKASGNINPGVYALGIKDAYFSGRMNVPLTELSRSSFAHELSDVSRNFAYKLGQSEAKAEVKAEQKAIDDTVAKAKKKGTVKSKAGKVIVEDGVTVNENGEIDESSLTEVQKANLVGVKALAELSPINFHIFQSKKVGGKFVAKINGTPTSANGVYMVGTNDIWIDLNAGDMGEGTMLWTASHEISHYIKERSPAKWKAMADFVIGKFSKKQGVSVTEMLDKQKAKIMARADAGTKTETEILDEAYEELVSDALSDMLTDGNVINTLAEIKQENKGVWQTIMDAVADLLRRWGEVLGVYKGRTHDTAEAQALAGMEKAYKKLQKMYAEAFAEANAVEYSRMSLESTVEETEDLIAMHNITSKQLVDAYERGGIAGPSVAVSRNGITKFGEISFVLNKDSIDPNVNSNNKVFGSDAWTPNQTQLKKNAVFDRKATQNAINDINNSIGEHSAELFGMTAQQFENAISEGDGVIYDAMAQNIGMKTAYALNEGVIDSIPENSDGTVNTRELNSALEALNVDAVWRGYRMWLNGISDSVITSYDNADVSEVVANMQKKPDTAKPFRLTVDGQLTVPAVRYGGIEDLRQNKHRLSEDADKAAAKMGKKLVDYAKDIAVVSNSSVKDVVASINTAFESRYRAEGIVASFANDGLIITQREAAMLQKLYKETVELPTEYFEAKALREVGFDEVRAAVIPESFAKNYADIVQGLRNYGVEVHIYEDGNDSQRLSQLNSLKGVKFQDRNATEKAKSYLKENGIDVVTDGKQEAASLYSVRNLLDNKQQKEVAEALATRFDVTPKEAMKWLKAETSMASLILNPKYSKYLDYEADSSEDAIKKNSDYPQGTVDFSNICKKRRAFTEVMGKVLRNFPNHVFMATDLAKIRTIMADEKMEVACAICYVEDRRQLDSIVGQNFLDSLELYRQGSKTRPDGKPFNAQQIKAFKLIEGDSYTPSIYELVTLEGRNELKAKNPNMEAAWVTFNNARGMQSVRLLTNEAEYKRQILKYNPNTVKSKNDLGGLRIYSFSDMEMFHLIDIIQVLTDSAAVGLMVQGYTKVNEYAKAVKDTGEKLNRSLIPKGALGYHMENGKVVLDYDTVEGIDINHPDFFDSTDNPNVGNIVIGINETQIRAAMVDPFIDYIIPFHTGQSKEVLGEKGIAEWNNYEDSQSERDLATGKKSSHQINIYTEVFQAAEKEGKPIKNKWDFVDKFLEVCKENGLKPRFAEFLNINEKGEYVYTEGYHKFLVDFKTFDSKTGEYLPQMPVKPIFDDAYLTKLLENHVKEQKARDAELAKSMPTVIERITKEIIKPEMKLSERNTSPAPTFYSHMGKVIDGIKQEKVGAGGVVPYLKGKGVKNEEIKWSGIEAWLEGKKSVTKAELQEFVAGSMLQIGEQMSSNDINLRYEGNNTTRLYDREGNVLDTFTYNSFMGGYVSEATEEVYSDLEEAVREEYGSASSPRWVDYKLEGGSNYREIVFTMPNSAYTNRAMKAHWGQDAEGVLVHARIQDFIVDGKKMLFVEELQSDWHNEGHSKGYSTKEYEDAVATADSLYNKYKKLDSAFHKYARSNDFMTDPEDVRKKKFDWLRGKVETAEKKYHDAESVVNSLKEKGMGDVTDAPFKYTYHEYVMKRLVRMAAENGYDSIGWTPAEIQVERWSEEFAEGYRIEYDQDIPKFMNKYGKKWGAKVGTAVLSNGTEIWSMPITDSMKDSVLYEGQALYSERNTDSNRSLLANALETTVQNEIEANKLKEYKDKIALIDAEQTKLAEINAEIRELSFAKGKRDTERLKALRFDAVQAANRINTYDRQLLNLESTKVLKEVLKREKGLAMKRQKQKNAEAQKAYREKVVETRDKREATKKLQKLILDTAKWVSYPKKDDVKVPDMLRGPYADFLESIDLSSKRLLSGGEATQNDQRIASAMNSLATAIEQIKTAQNPTADTNDISAEAHDVGYLDLPVNFVVNLRKMAENITKLMVPGDYVVGRMSAQDVKNISKLIKILNHSIREMSTMYSNLRFSHVEEAGDNAISFMEDIGEAKSTNAVADFVSWENGLPYYVFKRFGKAGESIFEELMDAQDKLAFLSDEIFKFKDKNWTDKEANAWGKDTHTIKLPSGNEITLTTADAMGIYCLSRREQALLHLLGGGIRVIGTTKGAKKASDSRSTLTMEDIGAIVSSLSDRQKKVAEAIQEFMSTTCAEWGNEISMKRFLTREFREKYYYPIESSDENLPVKDKMAQQADLYRLLNISATKPLTEGANNAVVIRNIFEVFTNHVSDMAKLNAFGMALLDYMKWVNYRESATNDNGQIITRGVRQAMNSTYGDKAFSYVLNLIKDVNGRYNDGGDHAWLMKMTRAAKTASVGNSLRVAALQITSYPRAGYILSQKSLALGLAKLPQIKKAQKYCGIALWKSFGFYDTNISRSIEDQIKGTTDIKQKLIEWSLKGAEWGDALTWGLLWNACEYEVAKTKQYKIGTEEFNQAVGKKLREVVYATQVVDSTLTRSQIMRNKSGLTQSATAFMSEPTLSANILMDAGFQFNLEKRRTGSIKSAWKKTGKHIGRAVAIYSLGQITAATIEALFDAYRDDDDEEFKEKFAEAFKKNVITDLMPFNKIPIISDLAEFVLSRFDLGYFSSDNLSTTWLSQAATAYDAWAEVLSGEETSKTVYNAIYNTARALSSMTGVAGAGLMREVVVLWNNTAGAYDSTLKIKTYENTKAQNGQLLYEAIIKGDTRQAESLKAQFEDEDAVSKALVKALRENDPRIKEAAEARLNGDTTEYLRIAESIKAEGNFHQDLIVYAINSEMNALKKDDGESSSGFTSKPTFTNSDYYNAAVNGDAADVKAVKDYLIESGKTESQIQSSFNSSVKNAYEEGEITSMTAVSLMTSYGGKTSDEASTTVKYIDFKTEYPEYADSITELKFENYYEPIEKYYGYSVEDMGIGIGTYAEYCVRSAECEGVDADGDGKIDSGSKKAEVMQVINELSLTSEQKDALYYLNGWAVSTLWEAPWH